MSINPKYAHILVEVIRDSTGNPTKLIKTTNGNRVETALTTVSSREFAARMPTRGFQQKGLLADKEVQQLLGSQPVSKNNGAYNVRESENYILKGNTTPDSNFTITMASGSRKNAKNLRDSGFSDYVDEIPLNIQVRSSRWNRLGKLISSPFEGILEPGIYQLQKKAPGQPFANNREELLAFRKGRIPNSAIAHLVPKVIQIERAISATIPNVTFKDHALNHHLFLNNWSNIFATPEGKITFIDFDPDKVRIPIRHKRRGNLTSRSPI